MGSERGSRARKDSCSWWFYQEFYEKYSNLYRYCAMINAARLTDGRIVMDVGGGDGYISLHCARAHCIANHIDIDSALIEVAEANAERYGINEVNYTVGTAENLRFVREESVDIVFCGEVLEHLSQDNIAIREAYRILKPSGRYVLTTPNANALPYVFLRALPSRFRVWLFRSLGVKTEYHGGIVGASGGLPGKEHLGHKRTGYVRKELESKLISSGFRIEKSEGFGFLMPAIIASRLPPVLYKLIWNLGSFLSAIASKHIIVARKD